MEVNEALLFSLCVSVSPLFPTPTQNERDLAETVQATDWTLTTADKAEIDRILQEEGVPTYVGAAQAIYRNRSIAAHIKAGSDEQIIQRNFAIRVDVQVNVRCCICGAAGLHLHLSRRLSPGRHAT